MGRPKPARKTSPSGSPASLAGAVSARKQASTDPKATQAAEAEKEREMGSERAKERERGERGRGGRKRGGERERDTAWVLSVSAMLLIALIEACGGMVAFGAVMHAGKRNPACHSPIARENSLVVEEAVNLPSFRAAALARPRGFATLFRNGEGPSLCRRLARLHSQGLQQDNSKRAASPAPQPAPGPQTKISIFPRLALARQAEISLNNTKANDSCWALVSLASPACSRIDQECARALGCGVLANLRHGLQKLGSLQRVDGPRLGSSFTGHLQASSGKGSTGTSRAHTECL